VLKVPKVIEDLVDIRDFRVMRESMEILVD
jgi:hypothetical protein